MPTEKRDPHSGAKLFIPSASERATIANARKLQKELIEVEDLKKELKALVEQAKGAQ